VAWALQERDKKGADSSTKVGHLIPVGGGFSPVAFDTTQITSKSNYSNPKPGDPCHPLASGAHPPAIAFAQNTRDEVRMIGGDGQIVGALASEPGMKQQAYVAFSCKDYGNDAGDIAPTLRSMNHDASHANGGGQAAVAFQTRIARNGRGQPKDICDALTSSEGGTHADSKPHIAYSGGVRRLTPRECERLQAFPDDYTLVTYRKKPAADGPRYSALGNSMACNVMRWIGTRIQMVEATK
jgi:DNA (cytosine-5)-methyltransferase 1